VADEDEAVSFELDVDGQRAVIDPTDAWISSGYDHRCTGATDRRARALCVRLGLDRVSYDWVHLTFHEAILGIGERIALFGAGVREPDRDPGAGERISPQDGNRVCASARTRASLSPSRSTMSVARRPPRK
jgi:hypothetical protein